MTPPEPDIRVDPDLPEPSQDSTGATIPLHSPDVVPSTLPVLEIEEEDDAINCSNSNHLILKRALIKHFQYAYINGNIHWPKPFTKTQRKRCRCYRLNRFLYSYMGDYVGTVLFV